MLGDLLSMLADLLYEILDMYNILKSMFKDILSEISLPLYRAHMHITWEFSKL